MSHSYIVILHNILYVMWYILKQEEGKHKTFILCFLVYYIVTYIVYVIDFSLLFDDIGFVLIYKVSYISFVQDFDDIVINKLIEKLFLVIFVII